LFSQLKISVSVVGRSFPSEKAEKLDTSATDTVAEKLGTAAEKHEELPAHPSTSISPLSRSSLPHSILSSAEAVIYNPVILDVVGVFNIPLNVPQTAINGLGNCYVSYKWMFNGTRKVLFSIAILISSPF
jgi:hypothetical protein